MINNKNRMLLYYKQNINLYLNFFNKKILNYELKLCKKNHINYY